MTDISRSGCPINLSLEVLGDKWSLLIIRDMMFGNRRHFRELLTKSEEGISSNILADRLKTLLDQTPEPVRQDVRCDAFLGLGQQLAEMPPVAEDHVADDQQAPFVAHHLERQIDRASRSLWGGHSSASKNRLQSASIAHMVQPVAICKQIG